MDIQTDSNITQKSKDRTVTQGWVVYTRLDINKIYSDEDILQVQIFETPAAADGYLDGSALTGDYSPTRREVGWMEPIPIVDLRKRAKMPEFSGPYLRDRVQFDGLDNESGENFRQLVETVWQDCGADLASEVITEVMNERKIVSPTECDPASLILNDAEHKEVQRRIGERSLPEIECYLSEGWDFRQIELNARRRLSHVNPGNPNGVRSWLLDIAADLEVALLNKHSDLCVADIFHFWTSLQVHGHIAECCRLQFAAGEPCMLRVDWALHEFKRALGSYAHEVRQRDPQVKRGSRRQRIEPHPDPESLLGKREIQTFRTASQVTGFSKRYLRNLIEEGKLETVDMGAARRITTDSLRSFLSLQTRKVEKSGNPRR